MIKNCAVCNKEFKTYPSRIKIGRGKYCSKSCADSCLVGRRLSLETEFKKGEFRKDVKGEAIKVTKTGRKYREIYHPAHPHSSKRGYVKAHRLAMEFLLGRYLRNDEVVHHIDNNGLNNKIENLVLMSKKDHDRMNTPLNIHKRWVKNGGVAIPHP